MTVHQSAGTMPDTGTRPHPTGSTAEPPVLGGPDYTDYYRLDSLLTDEQRGLRQRVRAFMDEEVIPVINPYWERAEFPHELAPKLAPLGIAGFQIDGYDCPGMSNVTAGLVVLELPCDSLSMASFSGVPGSRRILSIAML